MANWSVRDWMNSTPLLISPTETLRRARALLQTGNVAELLVVDGGKLVGTFSERDLWNRCPKGTLVLDEKQTDELLAVIQVGGVMIIHPPTVTPEMSLFEAAKLFVQSGRQGLPVVDQGVPIGLLTQHHVLEAMAALQGELNRTE